MTREEQIDWLCRLRADLNNGVIFTPWNKEFTEALTDVLENNGEPFEGMTNGEVIQALFPKAKIFENDSHIEYPYVDVFLYSENDMNCFKREWWNAPYQKGGEE